MMIMSLSMTSVRRDAAAVGATRRRPRARDRALSPDSCTVATTILMIGMMATTCNCDSGANVSVTELSQCSLAKLFNANGVSVKTLKHLFWLHIPKTGTSFGNTVFPYACPRLPPTARLSKQDRKLTKTNDCKGCLMKTLVEKYPPATYCDADSLARELPPDRCIAGHRPLAKALVYSRRGVSLFRSPRARLVSAFPYRHAVGIQPHLRPGLDNVTTLQEYAMYPGIQGCQLKMLLGRNCGYNLSQPITPIKAVQAIRHVTTALAYVGITDFWDTSICLFHRQLGGTLDPAEFRNVRPKMATSTPDPASMIANRKSRRDSASTTDTETRDDAAGVANTVSSDGSTAGEPASVSIPALSSTQQVVVEGAVLDPLDAAIYQAALRIFVRRCRKFNVDVPQRALDSIVEPSILCLHRPHTVLCSSAVWREIRRIEMPPGTGI
eukprot:m.210969 g.210969  ORF g.210969 m.210969 type:complete len:439 (+) comp25331_c0_seq1:184-1500(+)